MAGLFEPSAATSVLSASEQVVHDSRFEAQVASLVAATAGEPAPARGNSVRLVVGGGSRAAVDGGDERVVPASTASGFDDGLDHLLLDTRRTAEVLHLEVQYQPARGTTHDAVRYDVRLANGKRLPAWLSIDTASGLLFGAPPVGASDTMELRITVTLSNGATLARLVEIDVTTGEFIEVREVAQATATMSFADQIAHHSGDFDRELNTLTAALA